MKNWQRADAKKVERKLRRGRPKLKVISREWEKNKKDREKELETADKERIKK